jgi:curved DNA-binding protein CbpA
VQVNRRRKPRRPSEKTYSISWQDVGGLTHSAKVEATDGSDSGVGIRSAVDLPKGTVVYIQDQEGTPVGYAEVHHSTQRGGEYFVGLKLDEATPKTPTNSVADYTTDYYEFLEISPRAQAETLQRVYRFLAARYHPDNQDTGDPEKFLLLNRAYAVLSDPAGRAKYDATRETNRPKPRPVFESIDFLDGVEGEVNRRVAVLSLLYRQCRANIHNPRISLLELEAQMGFPREYLDFTMWYLRSMKYIKQEDNAEFALTSLGVDYVESNYSKVPLFDRLLNPGSRSSCTSNGKADSLDKADSVDKADPVEANL